MDVGDPGQAVWVLRRINYYRLRGCRYPFRQQVAGTRSDDFYPGARLDDAAALYHFDATLKAAAFSVLAPTECTIRALLGHELGQIGPCAHLHPNTLRPTARTCNSYFEWLCDYGARSPTDPRRLRQTGFDVSAGAAGLFSDMAHPTVGWVERH